MQTKTISDEIPLEPLFSRGYTFLSRQNSFVLFFQEFEGLKPSFYLECYENRPHGEMMAYLFAEQEPGFVSIDSKWEVPENDILREYAFKNQLNVDESFRSTSEGYGVWVSDHYRGKGFAQKLLNTAFKITKQKYRLNFIRISTDGVSNSFYLKLFPRHRKLLKAGWEEISFKVRLDFIAPGAGDRVRTDGN